MRLRKLFKKSIDDLEPIVIKVTPEMKRRLREKAYENCRLLSDHACYILHLYLAGRLTPADNVVTWDSIERKKDDQANKEKDLNFLSAIKDMVGTLKEKHDPIVVERVLRMLDIWEEEIKIKDAL